MKFQIIFILCFYCSVLYSQFEWESLPAHNASQIEILSMTESGELFGFVYYPNSIVHSIDKGETWSELYSGGLIKPDENYIPILKYSPSGELLMAVREAMYVYNSNTCLLYTSPSPRDATLSRMPSSA